ncbi:unnamed protein product [Trichogramma brassicae]|uniref:Uncharacterized protein n=1 Tax=Trichogramma brassicae TaxID=86971 RepID=A0A6H5IN94_9HYME|nr:unnamed protein product [Trichogramma brassicae]
MSSDDESNSSFDGEDNHYDSEEVDGLNQKKLSKLKGMRDKVNWEIEESRGEFLRELYPLIRDWNGRYPDLRDIFGSEKIERLLLDSINCKNKGTKYYDAGEQFICFVALSGYKDELNVGEDGEPVLNRTTPLHHAARCWSRYLDIDARALFKIYDRLDVNCIDEFGFTHFHAACQFGGKKIVKKFLELGLDPNCLVQKTGDSPLYLALRCNSKKVMQLLLRRGADSNLVNKDGLGSLHYICHTYFNDDFVELFFKINDEKGHTLQVDTQDKYGRTPLHLALSYGTKKVVELLLRRGADPNKANAKGSTPLHIICEKFFDDDMAELFFKICDDIHQTLQVDAQDKLGQTPLQLAVANLMPNTVDVLLDRGADLSSFVFPDESYFGKTFKSEVYIHNLSLKLRLASGALAVVERLGKRGYELDRSDALVIMNFFYKLGLFKKSANLEKYWCFDKEFEIKTKNVIIKPSLSLYDLIQVRLDEAAKLLSYTDYYEFTRVDDHWFFLPKGSSEACILHLCEMLSRGFLRQWGLEFFLTLTQYQLPILCCEIIIEQLKNKDVLRMCLATAADQSSCPRLCSSSRRILSKKKLRYTWPEAIGWGR